MPASSPIGARQRDPRGAGPASPRSRPRARRLEAAPPDSVPSLTMLLHRLDPRLATVIRLIALGLISSSVLNAHHHPSGSGRGLVVTVCFAACVVAWLAWTIRATDERGHTRRVRDDGRRRRSRRGRTGQRRERVRVRGRGRSRPAGGAFARVRRGRVGRARARRGGPRLRRERARVARVHARVHRRGAAASNSRQSACVPSRPSCCSRRRSAPTRSSCARRDSRSRPGSPVRSTTCSRTRSPG